MADIKPLRYVRNAGNTIGFSELQSGETIAWGDVNHPTFANVATSGSYTDLINTPAVIDTLDELTDVTITTPSTDQVLKYNGNVWVNATVPPSVSDLNGLTDVTITTPSVDQVLKYDGNVWVNATSPAGSTTLDGLTDVTITTPATDQILKYNGSAWVNADGSAGNPGLKMLFSTNTDTTQDPGNNYFRFNNANLASITEIAFTDFYISTTYESWIKTWDDSTSTDKGTIAIYSSDYTLVGYFKLTSLIDNTTWFRAGVTWLDGVPGSLTQDAVKYVAFIRTGDKGETGATGATGATGPAGSNGAAGADGISITNAQVNPSGNLEVTLSNLSVIDAGHVVGATGEQGIQGIQGIQGPAGTNGTNGTDGISVTTAVVNGSGNLEITLSNLSVIDAGHVVGATGATGATGAAGADGAAATIAVGNVTSNTGNVTITNSGTSAAAVFDFNIPPATNGLPTGGSTGQYLVKASATDFDASWATAYGDSNVAAYTGNISAKINGFSIGYLEVPQVTSANVTFALSDSGKHYYSTSGAVNTLTIPSNANVAFPIGTAITLINQGTANIAIAKQTDANLFLAGNTTNATRTLTSYGMASLIKVATDTWFINGTGLV